MIVGGKKEYQQKTVKPEKLLSGMKMPDHSVHRSGRINLPILKMENQTIDVEYVGLPKDSSKSKMDTAIAADDMPELASVQTSWLPEFRFVKHYFR